MSLTVVHAFVAQRVVVHIAECLVFEVVANDVIDVSVAVIIDTVEIAEHAVIVHTCIPRLEGAITVSVFGGIHPQLRSQTGMPPLNARVDDTNHDTLSRCHGPCLACTDDAKAVRTRHAVRRIGNRFRFNIMQWDLPVRIGSFYPWHRSDIIERHADGIRDFDDGEALQRRQRCALDSIDLFAARGHDGPDVGAHGGCWLGAVTEQYDVALPCLHGHSVQQEEQTDQQALYHGESYSL